jgi:hypothetical protein
MFYINTAPLATEELLFPPDWFKLCSDIAGMVAAMTESELDALG